MLTYVRNPDDFKQLIEKSKTQPVIIFKHSSQCDVSGQAYDEFHRFMKSAKDVTGAVLFVIEFRDVSDEIESTLGIQHKSPQVILVRDGKAQWTASHWSITAAALSQALYAESPHQ